MEIPAMIIATLCYLVVGIGNLRQRDYPHAMMWIAYAIANLSLLWYECQKRSVSG